MQPSNTRAILISLAGNAVISLAKFVAAAFTGSAAMLSEAVHALADTTHELLLLLGVRQAEALPDDLAAREKPSGRKPVAEIAVHGRF